MKELERFTTDSKENPEHIYLIRNIEKNLQQTYWLREGGVVNYLPYDII